MNHLYQKLAWMNIKSNKHFYLPYLLTGMASVMMFYCMYAMQGNKGLSQVRGGSMIVGILMLGKAVIGFFVSILLFYTNSFIMKRRKKELGIYNILGMEKQHIAKIMFWETIFTFFLSAGIGLLFGISFHKLLTMFLYQLTGLEERIPFYISWFGCLHTVELFAGIYFATFLYNFMKIQLANPIELLNSKNAGEREPKTKMLMSLAGICCLGTGYYISITTENPLQAITLFFVAVILVIIGTYCLFTAGSIALLKMLRKNKHYYYQTRHFTAVSGMIYRMKQNAAGLANICILSTMVLVMISTTVSMYIGLEDELNYRYEAELGIEIYFLEMPEKEIRERISSEIEKSIMERGQTITMQTESLSMGATVLWTENEILFPKEEEADWNHISSVDVMTKENYEKLTGNKISELGEGEIALACYPVFDKDQIVLNQAKYQVAELVDLPEAETKGIFLNGSNKTAYLIFQDEEVMKEVVSGIYAAFSKMPERSLPSVTYYMNVDVDGTAEEKLACAAKVREVIRKLSSEMPEIGYSYYVGSRQEGYMDFLSINGGLFFLGLFLGSMFLMVTVLIIYYKQISEGYEDKERFAIMQKVGMSRAEVKGAIFAQIRIVFFLPLLMAAIHLAAAFPLLRRLLAMLNLMNWILFVWCLVGTLLVFGIIYLVVFLITSRSYYRIVGEGR